MLVLHLYEGVSRLFTEIISHLRHLHQVLLPSRKAISLLQEMLTKSARTKCNNRRSNEMASSSRTANGTSTQINALFSAFVSTSELKRKCTQHRKTRNTKFRYHAERFLTAKESRGLLHDWWQADPWKSALCLEDLAAWRHVGLSRNYSHHVFWTFYLSKLCWKQRCCLVGLPTCQKVIKT